MRSAIFVHVCVCVRSAACSSYTGDAMTITLVGSSRELRNRNFLPPIDLLDLLAANGSADAAETTKTSTRDNSLQRRKVLHESCVRRWCCSPKSSPLKDADFASFGSRRIERCAEIVITKELTPSATRHAYTHRCHCCVSLPYAVPSYPRCCSFASLRLDSAQKPEWRGASQRWGCLTTEIFRPW